MTRSNHVSSVILILSVFQGCSDAEHYRIRHDADSLYAVLHADISSGDSLEEVQQLLGAGQAVEGAEKLRTFNAIRHFAESNPAGYPDGVEDGDTLAKYPMGKGVSISLQFRGGTLVNHVPEHFKDGPDGVALAVVQ